MMAALKPKLSRRSSPGTIAPETTARRRSARGKSATERVGFTLPGWNSTSRRLAVGCFIATIGAAGNPGRVEAYRFYSLRDANPILSAAEASRWDIADFPLRFHLQDNIPDYLEEGQWRGIVEDGLAEWTAIRTADIRLSLEPDLVEGDGADSGDERLTIGWVSSEGETWSGRAHPVFRVSTHQLVHCDITMNADRFREWLDDGLDPDVVYDLVRDTVVHEVGHCLGLRHTEPHPIPGWLEVIEDPPPIPAGFLPETVMSYGFGTRAAVTEDEATAVSLLYPATGFNAARGAVSGRLVRDSAPVPFAYVQAVYLGSRPRMGPGAFADQEGYFHLQGLEAGPTLLWVHPILIHYSNAHGSLLTMAFECGGLDVLDQWQWVSVRLGETVGVPDLVLAAGRLP